MSQLHSLSQNELLDVLSRSKNATAVYNSDDMTVRFATDAMLAFWKTGNTVAGGYIGEIGAELKDRSLKKMLRQVLKTGIPFTETITAENIAGGRLQVNHYEHEYSAIKNKSGQSYLLHTVSDITDRVVGRRTIEKESEQVAALAREQLLNEELQAINEELKMVNDELRSSQENLRLLNDELEQRVANRTSQLSESETRFRSMAESSGIPIMVSDQTRNFTYFSKAWLELTGKSILDLAGFGWTDLIHCDDKEHFMSVYLSSFKKQEPFSVEFRIWSSKRQYRWLMCNGFPRLMPDLQFAGYVGSCMDISELKILHQRKDDFISIASHELKTPLTSLKATMQLLDRIKGQPDREPFVKLILQANRSLEKITALVNDLLGYTRTTEGLLPLKKNVFKPADLVNQCFTHIRIEGKYELVLSGGQDLVVYADEAHIEQVLINIVNNALKYAPQSTKIFVSIEKLDEHVKISVRDTGPGIAKDLVSQLFQRYMTNQDGERRSGLGLGLYISSEIIKRHGGSIGVESVPGSGTTVWFTLPPLSDLTKAAVN